MTEVVSSAKVGPRLRTARVRRELSQRATARRAGIAPSYLSRIENGHIQPSFATVYRIAEALHADLHEIVTPEPEDESRGCPITPDGRCLLDLVHDDRESAMHPSAEYFSAREIRLLHQLAVWMKTVTPDRLRAMEILIEDWAVSVTERAATVVEPSPESLP